MNKTREVWQRGPVEGVPPLLQPVAHALLQAVEEVNIHTKGITYEYLWRSPSAVASAGFHLKHMAGVLDRLFTYARGESLTETQRHFLSLETIPGDKTEKAEMLAEKFEQQVARAIIQLTNTDDKTLLERRGIGREQIPTNVLGLLFHAAEHVQRHVGQFIVTARIVKAGF